MKKFVGFVESCTRLLGKGAAWCALAMMLFQMIAVLMRYIFNYGLITFQEAVVYCHAILFLFGAAYVLQINQHVRVDIFYDIYSEKNRKRLDVIGLLFFVLPVAAVITWYAWPYVVRSWNTLEGSRQAGGIPAIFLLKTAIVVFSISLAMQVFATVIKLVTGMDAPSWQKPVLPEDHKEAL